LNEALRRASAAAALATTRVGAQASIPTYDDVESLLRSQAGAAATEGGAAIADAASARAAYSELAIFCGVSPAMSVNQATDP
jgi:hypothetical protein